MRCGQVSAKQCNPADLPSIHVPLCPGGWLRNTFGRPEVRGKFHGILNGIDTEEWDPACDPLLPANFSADQAEGKALCKRYLQRGLGLEEDAGQPLVAVVTRLVPQKGIHLIKAAIYRTLSQVGGNRNPGGAVVMLMAVM